MANKCAKLIVCVDSDINKDFFKPSNSKLVPVDSAKGSPIENVRLISMGGTMEWKKSVEDAVTSYILALTGVRYDKKMFDQGEVELEFSATGTPPADQAKTIPFSEFVNDPTYLNKVCYLDVFGVKAGQDPAAVSDFKAVNYIAKNYCVQGVSIESHGSFSHTLRLECRSIDCHLTTTPYCKVYRGKSFGSEICAGSEMGPFLEEAAKNLDTVNVKESATQKVDLYDFRQKSDRLMMMGYNASESKHFSGPGKHNDKELLHPYLVQYNESFYDFMVRVAHRCGEFLYFEDGMLHLGLPSQTWNALAAATLPATPTDLKCVPLCSYPWVPFIKGKDVNGFHKDYVNGVAGDYVNASAGEKKGNYRYDLQYASDEDLHTTLETDNKISPAGSWIAYSALGTLFTSDEFLGGLISAVGGAAKEIFMGLYLTPKYVKKDYKTHLDAKYRISEDIGIAKTATATAAGIDDTSNLCNSFFRYVEQMEDRAEQKKVEMDFSSNLPDLRLGALVNLKDGVSGYYVVTRMYGKYTTSLDESTGMKKLVIKNSAEGVPVFNEKFEGMGHLVFPERGDIPHSKTVAPREAIVKDNADPLRLGRVRVQYPWQSDTTEYSPWLRIAVPFTGTPGTGGFTMTPENGEHVMLNYVDGNIERPYVEGSLYYREYDSGKKEYTVNKPEIGGIEGTVPAFFKTSYKVHSILSGKGHGLMIHDAIDKSVFSTAVPALGVLMNVIGKLGKKGDFFDINVDALKVKGGQVTLMDGSCFCEIDLLPLQRKINISSKWGSVNISAFTGIEVIAPNGDISIKGKNVSIEAGNNLSLKSGTNIGEDARPGEKGAAGAAGVALGKMAAQIMSALVAERLGIDINNMCDMSFLRAVYEMVMRPVEGTMSIGSKRHIVMTAGKGKVRIPKSLLSSAPTGTKGKSYGDVAIRASDKLLQEIGIRRDIINTFCGDYRQRVRTLSARIDEFKTAMQDSDKFKADVKSGYDTFEKVYGFIKEDNNNFQSKTEALNVENEGVETYNSVKAQFDAAKKAMQDFKANSTVSQLLIKINKGIDDASLKYSFTDEGGFMENDKWPMMNENKNTVDSTMFVIGNLANDGMVNEYVERFRKVAIRSIIVQAILKKCGEGGNVMRIHKIQDENIIQNEFEQAITINHFTNAIKNGEEYWDKFVRRLDYAPREAAGDGKLETGLKGFATGLSSVIGAGKFGSDGKYHPFYEKLTNNNGEAGPRAWSETVERGKIFLSDGDGSHSTLNDNMDGWNAESNATLETLKEEIGGDRQ